MFAVIKYLATSPTSDGEGDRFLTVDPLDICLFRSVFLTIGGFLQTKVVGHDISNVPKELRKILLIRCIAGTFSFALISVATQFIPLSISIILANTTPFWTAILGFVILHEEIASVDIVCMIGCFLGVIILS
mmetsp:Transcript_34875/g.53541  ORF Transcript_34875/g.53541 Transcript_34875/m.53541 type:complete len:132 (+) Transcript_34875:54-449(+)